MDATGESTMNKPPDRLVDRYSFQRFLGTRDPFRVWLAHDERLMRDVAIKQFLCKVRPGDVRGQRMRKMAVREAQAASQISHHNVLRVYDLVESDDLIWLVMEFLPSRSLRDLVCEHTRLGPAYVASVGVAVLDALTAAHREGVLHRDVTPDNVLIGENGRVALTDFGLAAWNPYDGRTLFGADPHAPHYVAPERARFGLSIPEGDLWSSVRPRDRDRNPRRDDGLAAGRTYLRRAAHDRPLWTVAARPADAHDCAGGTPPPAQGMRPTRRRRRHDAPSPGAATPSVRHDGHARRQPTLAACRLDGRTFCPRKSGTTTQICSRRVPPRARAGEREATDVRRGGWRRGRARHR
jgi:serine/threonine protein kinase